MPNCRTCVDHGLDCGDECPGYRPLLRHWRCKGCGCYSKVLIDSAPRICAYCGFEENAPAPAPAPKEE
jgi:hypothetical protein